MLKRGPGPLRSGSELLYPIDVSFEAVKRQAARCEKSFPFEIIHTTGPANNMSRFHWHDFVEISYVRSGHGVYEVEESTFTVGPGDYVIVKSGERHRVTYQPGSKLFETVMHFAPSLICYDCDDRLDAKYLELFLASPETGVNRVRVPPQESHQCARLVERIQEEFQTRAPLYDLMIKAKLLSLVTTLLRHGGFDSSFDTEETARQRSEMQRRNEITSYIRTQSHVHLTLREVAERFAMNPSYFSTWFHKHVGVTFSRFLAQTRVEKAIPLIQDGKLRITDIIYECGFSAPASFYRAFHETTGSSPGTFTASRESASAEPCRGE